MAVLDWIPLADRLRPADLTVRAQALPPNDEGELLWDAFMPRENVNSVKVSELTTLDYRPAADRREWNAEGRQIPLQIPTMREIRITPIEAWFGIDEEEMQRLMEPAQGNELIVRQQIAADVPGRVDMIAMADYRRLEVEVMSAWALGQFTQRNPEDASKTYAVSYGFPSTRYTTASPAWNDASVNAYDLLLAWIAAARKLVGEIEGAVLREASLAAILADAPNLAGDVPMTRSRLEERISEDADKPFRFFVVENTLDVFTDGGTATTKTAVWPANIIAAIPVGRRVGRTAFAPVVRAWELVREAGPGAGIDVNGVTVYYTPYNAGKGLRVQAQVNAMAIPDEQKVYVTNIGV